MAVEIHTALCKCEAIDQVGSPLGWRMEFALGIAAYYETSYPKDPTKFPDAPTPLNLARRLLKRWKEECEDESKYKQLDAWDN